MLGRVYSLSPAEVKSIIIIQQNKYVRITNPLVAQPAQRSLAHLTWGGCVTHNKPHIIYLIHVPLSKLILLRGRQSPLHGAEISLSLVIGSRTIACLA